MPRIIEDRKLEWEVDHSGIIHVRKHPGETEVLPGYGTTDFGVKSYVPKRKLGKKIFLAGAAALGILSFRYAERLAYYALLLKESRSA